MLSGPFTHEPVVRQPGEPTAASWTLSQADETQPIQFRLQVAGEGGGIERSRLEIDGVTTIELPVALAAGESLVCDGTTVVRVYDAKGRQTRTITLAALPPAIAPGRHAVSFDSTFIGGGTPRVEVIFKTRGSAERVRATGR